MMKTIKGGFRVHLPNTQYKKASRSREVVAVVLAAAVQRPAARRRNGGRSWAGGAGSGQRRGVCPSVQRGTQGWGLREDTGNPGCVEW